MKLCSFAQTITRYNLHYDERTFVQNRCPTSSAIGQLPRVGPLRSRWLFVAGAVIRPAYTGWSRVANRSDRSWHTARSLVVSGDLVRIHAVVQHVLAGNVFRDGFRQLSFRASFVLGRVDVVGRAYLRADSRMAWRGPAVGCLCASVTRAQGHAAAALILTEYVPHVCVTPYTGRGDSL